MCMEKKSSRSSNDIIDIKPKHTLNYRRKPSTKQTLFVHTCLLQ